LVCPEQSRPFRHPEIMTAQSHVGLHVYCSLYIYIYIYIYI
jgi:hypothetical protein